MVDCCTWLSRPSCCRRQQQHAYIYLYSPTMPDSSSTSTSSSNWCLVCILFGLCLAFVVILAAVLIYHINSNNFIRQIPFKSMNDTRLSSIAKKRQLPDFVNINIDPCENFYDFVCDNLNERKNHEQFTNEQEYEQKWKRIQYDFHEKLMINIDNQNDHISPSSAIYRLYQLCENQSPDMLFYELEYYFKNLSQQEPYLSYLTLFNQKNLSSNIIRPSLFSLIPNPFIKIEPLSYISSTIRRIPRRPLPSIESISPKLPIVNQTAYKYLIKFDNDYKNFLSEEQNLIKSYEQEYNQDSLIIKRILTYKNYDQCYSSSLITSNKNGLENLIELLNYFLHTRLQNFNTQSIDKQIRILDKIPDNHTLVEHLQRIFIDIKTIEQIILLNNSEHSCIINLIEKLLDKRIKSYEFLTLLNIDTSIEGLKEDFSSNNWPFIIMLYDRLLKNLSTDILINFVYFDYYRQMVYPYYQPHLQEKHEINMNHRRDIKGYTYQVDYPDLSCYINSCFDIFNCYHPSLLNQLVKYNNQTYFNQIKNLTENLINRLRLLTEQSDNLFLNEKQQILQELNQIQIHIGTYPSIYNISLPSQQFSSYIEYVQIFSTLPYDDQERSYYNEPIYYPLNHTLYLPYSFISLSNSSIEYQLIKLLLKIIQLNLQSNPYHIECLLKTYDDEQDLLNNTTKFVSDNEYIVYLLLRSKYLSEQDIVLDEYLWPFMSANSLMKRFLIDYTAKNYCLNFNGYHLYKNNTYFIDDIHLIFHCPQASSIKQSKCTVI